MQEEKVVDPVYKELSQFIDVLMRADLSQGQQKRCFQILSLLTDLERVGDMAEDIAEYAIERMDNDVIFSDQATEDLEKLWTHAHKTYSMAIQAFQDGDRDQAQEVCRLEAEFDRMYWHTRAMHIERLEKGICTAAADVIFTETLRNLERISDHADNLGVSVIRN